MMASSISSAPGAGANNTKGSRSRRENAGTKMRDLIEEERARLESGQAELSDEDDADFNELLVATKHKSQDTQSGNYDDYEEGDDDVVDSDFEDTDSEIERAAEESCRLVEISLQKEERKALQVRKRKKVKPMLPGVLTKSKTLATDENSNTGQVNVKKPRKRIKPLFAVRSSNRSVAIQKGQESNALDLERQKKLQAKRERREREKANRESAPPLTQQDLLKEAKETEKQNAADLWDFESKEEEEKKRRQKAMNRAKPKIYAPVIHWRSFTSSSPKTDVENEGDKAVSPNKSENLSTGAPCQNTTVVLDKFVEPFWPINPWKMQEPITRPNVCPITGKAARYRHPKTGLPYANKEAYRVIEELANYEHLLDPRLDVWYSNQIE